jgi:hypothetical protein
LLHLHRQGTILVTQMDYTFLFLPPEWAKHIVKTIIAKLKQHSKDSGVKIPFVEAIYESVPTSENQVWGMTVTGRIMKYLSIITKMNMDTRPKVVAIL